MCSRLLHRLWAASRAAAQALHRRLAAATRPAAAPLVTGALADLARTKPDLLAENALLRQQLLILRRQMGRPLGSGHLCAAGEWRGPSYTVPDAKTPQGGGGNSAGGHTGRI